MAKKVVKRQSSTAAVGGVEARSLTVWLIVALAIIGVGLLFLLLFWNVSGPSPIQGLLNLGRQDRGHDDSVSYNTELPPPGGIHYSVWQNCGVYDQPIDTGNAVHSMEHGAVWITYRPDLPEREVERLQDVVRGEQFLLLSPYENLKSPVVLTAWQVQLELDSAGDRRIGQFIDQYRLGPTTPELGAACTDGLGVPIQ